MYSVSVLFLMWVWGGRVVSRSRSPSGEVGGGRTGLATGQPACGACTMPVWRRARTGRALTVVERLVRRRHPSQADSTVGSPESSLPALQ